MEVEMTSNSIGLHRLRNLAQTSEASHIGESDSASPPLPPSRRATAPLSKGGGGNA